eukprot:comp12051_c0_seq1/m.6757 comp12051_c0_seq1/g.6757  ORF comp12051_c0_seq1/g.6757 comp12051_c0_seq1/m.6757 type:complete len:552 (-) comp12051_c0_seq1:679-2334(-)
MSASSNTQLLQKIINLCKRRGFISQSYASQGGLRGCYNYGPLGVELKRNIANAWWGDIVHGRPEVYGLDTSIVMNSAVWATSGHLQGFTDRLVDCKLSCNRFRADKAPPVQLDKKGRLVVTGSDKDTAKQWAERIAAMHPQLKIDREGKSVIMFPKRVNEPTDGRHGSFALQGLNGEDIILPYRGYVCPESGSPFLNEERDFNLLFKTHHGDPDPIDDIVKVVLENSDKPKEEIRRLAGEATANRAVYLRPETAQGTFVQFPASVAAMNQRLPFGLAQIGKSFRNEISPERFVFRSLEFEQMELEYFCPASEAPATFDYWVANRLQWWQRYANRPEAFTAHPVDKSDLAHYAAACTDLEYEFPWGLDEVEGIANRTDFDLKLHSQNATDKSYSFVCRGRTGEDTSTPYVIEPAAGLTRAVLAYLCDAYAEENRKDAKGKDVVRLVLKLHPAFAPIKAAVLPLVKIEPKFRAIGRDLVQQLLSAGHVATYDDTGAVGRRYARHDEIGTPLCITIDQGTLDDGTVTVRDRDTTEQRRVKLGDVVGEVTKAVAI